VVTISRAVGSVTFPCRFMLVAAMNPCPCGYFGDVRHQCRCSPNQILNYRNKISGPLLDRIDIHIEVPSVKYQDISSLQAGESSATMRASVLAARKVQQERFKGRRKIHCNATMSAKDLQKLCKLGDEAQETLKAAMTQYSFSARAYDRILKVARTIADMDSSEGILPRHVCEAINYRNLDRQVGM
jgi:magnesium chelatase family protein